MLKRDLDLFNQYHLSVGDLLRNCLMDDKYKDDEEMVSSIRDQKLLSTNRLLPILESEIERIKARGVDFLFLDGMPRSLEQAVAFELTVCHASSRDIRD